MILKKGLSLPFDTLKLIQREISSVKGWPANLTLKSRLEKSMSKFLPPDIGYTFMIGEAGESCHWFCHEKSGKYLRLYN